LSGAFRFNAGVRPVQTRLWPDPRPLVERLGPGFFRQLPTGPAVYLMRDRADAILYVGKARNLRRRLGSYRVANPDRLPRRLLRLLAQVHRIEWENCADEAAALSREADLLRAVRPPFNRAGVWPVPPRFLLWRPNGCALELAVQPQPDAAWRYHGPLGAGALHLRVALVRLLWEMLQPNRGLAGMPAGWFHGRLPETVRLEAEPGTEAQVAHALAALDALPQGSSATLRSWVESQSAVQTCRGLLTVLEEDLVTVEHGFSVPHRRPTEPASA
jgi:predicted GIY-YIG superfamily endonuclease